MSSIKPASTILLARDTEGELEVLLLKRNKKLAFAGGLWVFPGGKIEPEEFAQSETELEAAKLAAVRETKEETNLEIEKEDLIFFRHWTTPAIEPRRFATYFFFGGTMIPDQEVKIDDSEIKQHMWIHPQLALDKYQQAELGMLPPTFLSLQLIRNCQTVSEARHLLEQESPIFVLPVMCFEDDNIVLLYEGDAGYEAGKAQTPGARHRLNINRSTRKARFEYEGCADVLPLHGGDSFFQ